MSDDSTRPLDDDDKQLLRLDQPDGLIQKVLASFGLGIDSIHRTQVGNNNSSFIVNVLRGPHRSHVGYAAGIFPFLPLTSGESRRVVFTTAQLKEDMDAAVMSANKVAAMKLIHDAGGYASTVTPHVYGWSDGKQDGKSCVSWSVVLSKLWDDLSDEKKLDVARCIGRVLKSLQEVSIPQRLYGAFTFEDFERDSPVTIGETCFHYGGPFKHVRDLYAGQILNQWESVKKIPRFDKWSGSQVTLRSRQVNLDVALEEVIAIVRADGPRWREITSGFEVQPGFIHGDFNEMNFMVDPETLQFTALLDFEFAQSGPPIDEFFQSLPSQGMIYLGMRPGNLDPEGNFEALQRVLQGVVHANPSAALLQKHAYIKSFQEIGVFGPWSMDPDVLTREAGVYWFGFELCNGPLQREAFWTSTEERTVERRERMLKNVRGNLEWDVKGWLE